MVDLSKWVGKNKDEKPSIVSRLWWLRLIVGIWALFFGIAAIFWPGLTLVTLVYLFSAFVIVWGFIELITGLRHIGERGDWWLTALFGVIGLGVGVYLVRNPSISFDTFVLVVGLALIVKGLLELAGVFVAKPKDQVHYALGVVAGIIALAAGIVVMLQPASGGVAMVWVLGLYSLIMGVLNIVLALSLHEDLL